MKKRRIVMAASYGFCGGVRRAIELAEAMLQRYPPPIYALNELVHNRQVVAELEQRGFRFVRSLDAVPDGAPLLFSAHGISPAIRRAAKRKRLQMVDATCPLVERVHRDVAEYAAAGYTILLLGQPGHDEVIGTMGEAPGAVTIIGSEAEANAWQPPAAAARVVVVTQTTLSHNETAAMLAALRRKLPELELAPSADICHATSQRQAAVVALAREAAAILVLGDHHSSNARRLVSVAEAAGATAWLIASEAALPLEALKQFDTIGLTASASTPPNFITAILTRLQQEGWEPPALAEAKRPRF